MYKMDKGEMEILLNAISVGVDETSALNGDDHAEEMIDAIEDESGGNRESIEKAYHIGRITAHIERIMEEWEFNKVLEDFPAGRVIEEVTADKEPSYKLRKIVMEYVKRGFRCGYYKALEDKWGETKEMAANNGSLDESNSKN